MINLILNAHSYFNLGRRYLKTLQTDRRTIRRKRAAFYTQAWEDAAAQTSSTIESLGNGMLKITKGNCNVFVFEQYTPLNDIATDRLIVNKAIIYDLLTKIDVPLPRYIHLKEMDISAAKAFMSRIGGPIVVKPAYGTGSGAGVTTNITGLTRLYKALAWSKAFCPETVIEEQLRGDNYRLLFLDGEFLDCVVRKPPTVVGDGVSSIRHLIRQENKKRIEPEAQLAQSLIEMDMDTKNSLAAQGLSLSTKPAKGQITKVKDVVNGNRGEENEHPSEEPAPSIIALGRKISETIGVRLLGIDIIADDLTVDLRESGGRIIEVNTPPGHYYHHMKKDKGYPVGVRLLQQLFTDQNTNHNQINHFNP